MEPLPDFDPLKQMQKYVTQITAEVLPLLKKQ